MNCIFNDLSFAEFVDCFPKLLPAFKELHAFRTTGISYGHDTYIHRNALYSLTICGQEFRQAVNLHILNREDKRRIFSLLDKSTPALPDDTVIPMECRFFYKGREIPCTGLAEGAFRLYMEDASLVYSLTCAAYAANTLSIQFESGMDAAEINVTNSIGLSSLKIELEKEEPDIRSWDELLQRVGRLSYIRIETSVRDSLEREPFEISLAKTVLERLKTVDEMASSTGSTHTELIKKYCHGECAMFSHESDTRINTLKEKLYFSVNGEKKLCSFHGKIRHRKFRIHMDKQPVPGEDIYIVYIGYKIL